MSDKNGLAVYQQQPTAVERASAIEPSNFDEAMRLADIVVQSGLYGIKNKADAFMRLATGAGLGLTSGQSLRGLYVINGKVGISADLMAALSESEPDCEYFRCVSSDVNGAVFEAKRKSQPEPVRLAFGKKDAEAAGLTSNPMYKKYPQRMYEARCKAALSRLMFPGKMHGLFTAEELRSIKPERVAVDVVRSDATSDPIEAALDVSEAEIAEANAEEDVADALEADALRERIEAAGSTEELAEVASIIKGAELSSGHRDALRGLYKTRKAQLEAAAAE